MRRTSLVAVSLALMLAVANCAPTINRATELGINDLLHIADEAPGSNNKSHNTSCCSSDPKGSTNSSSNRSVNLDDFREDKGSLSKGGPTIEQLLAFKRFLKSKGIKFVVQQAQPAHLQ